MYLLYFIEINHSNCCCFYCEIYILSFDTKKTVSLWIPSVYVTDVESLGRYSIHDHPPAKSSRSCTASLVQYKTHPSRKTEHLSILHVNVCILKSKRRRDDNMSSRYEMITFLVLKD